MNFAHRILPVILSAVFLQGCGGSSDKPTPPVPPPLPPVVKSFALNGHAIKGPLQHATVNVFALDSTKADFKGRLITSGSTNELAAFTNIQVSEPLSDFYLIEVLSNDKTIDITTGQQPVLPQLYSILSAEQLTASTAINATPLTTVISQTAANLVFAGEGVALALEKATQAAKLKLSFGWSSAYNPFIDSPLLSSLADVDVKQALAHRMHNEGTAALLLFIKENIKLSLAESIQLLTADLAGDFSKINSVLVEQYQAILERAPIPHLVITHSDKDGDNTTVDPFKLSEVNALLVQEQVLLASGLAAEGVLSSEFNMMPQTFGIDTDIDGYPNTIDADDDNDGVPDGDDAFPLDAAESVDTDKDGIGNNADTDDDNDGVVDIEDAFPLDANESKDSDNDGVGDNSDAFPLDASESKDSDNDGVGDNSDAFPLDAAESVDTDKDGIGNNADTDDDNDGVPDGDDAFPLDAAESVDTDKDGIGNNADTDDDNDGVVDTEDAFPLDASESKDSDHDGVGDNADAYPSDEACYLISDGDGNTCYLTALGGGDTYTAVVQSKEHELVFMLNSSSGYKVLLQNTVTQHFTLVYQTQNRLSQPLYHPEHQKVYFAESMSDTHHTILQINDGHKAEPFYELVINQVDQEILARIDKLAVAGESLAINYTQLSHYPFNNENSPAHYYPMGGAVVLNKQAGVIWQSDDGAKENRYPSFEYFVSSYAQSPVAYSFTLKPGHPKLVGTKIKQYALKDNVLSVDLIKNVPEYRIYGEYPTSYKHSPNRKYAVNTSVGDIFDSSTFTKNRLLGTSQTTLYRGLVDVHWLNDDELVFVGINSIDHIRRTYGKYELYNRNVISKRVIEGEILLPLYFDSYIEVLVKRNNKLVIERFDLNPDADADGILNRDDAFPSDPAAALDTDFDGFPDVWLPGKGESDSTLGLTLDSVPDDGFCWNMKQLNDGACDYSLESVIENKAIISSGDIVYLQSDSIVLRWSLSEERYLAPIKLAQGLFEPTISSIAVSDSQQRLYIALTSADVKYIDMTQPELGLQPFSVKLDHQAKSMTVLGEYLVVKTETSLQVINAIGVITDTLTQLNSYSLINAILLDSPYRAYLDFNHYIEINPGTGKLNQLSSEFDSNLGYEAASINRQYSWFIDPNGFAYDIKSKENLGKLANLSASNLSDQFSVSDILFFISNRTLFLWDFTTKTELTQFKADSWLEIIPSSKGVVLTYFKDGKRYFDYQYSDDSDNDGLPNWWELKHQFNPFDSSDAEQDSDKDGLTNLAEFNAATNPKAVDTDGDGLNDGAEAQLLSSALRKDSDGDGLLDGEEVNTYGTSPTSSDSDQDGLSDFIEVTVHFSNPNNHDSDGDGIADNYEVKHQLDINVNDSTLDNDNDGLDNLAEFIAGSSPHLVDSDGDSLSDYDEVINFMTSAIAKDTDGDRLTDDWEINNQFNPLNSNDGLADADADGFSNAEEFSQGTDLFDALDIPISKPWADSNSSANKDNFVFELVDTNQVKYLWQNVHPDVRVESESGRPAQRIESLRVANKQLYYTYSRGGHYKYPDPKPMYGVDVASGEQFGKVWVPDVLNKLIYSHGKLIAVTNDYEGDYPYGCKVMYIDTFSADLSMETRIRESQCTPYLGFSLVYKDELRFSSSKNARFNLLTNEMIYFSATETGVHSIANDIVIWGLTGFHYQTDAKLFSIPTTDTITAANQSRYKGLFAQTENAVSRYTLVNNTLDWQLDGVVSNLSHGFGYLYGYQNGQLVQIDELSGEIRWKVDVIANHSNIVVGRNKVIVASATQTFIVDINDKSIVTLPHGGHELALNGGKLFIADKNTVTAYAVNAL